MTSPTFTGQIVNPGIGHNAPPSDEQLLHEQLEKDHAEIVAAAQEHIKALAEPMPVCESQDDIIALTTRAAIMDACAKAMEKTREAVKEPFFKKGKWIDNFFNPKKVLLEAGVKKYKAAISDWQTREAKRIQDAADAQAKADREAASEKLNEAIAHEGQGNNASAAVSMTEAAKLEKTAGKSERAAINAPAAAKISVAIPGGGLAASVVKRWAGKILSREHLDLEKLRIHFTDDALQTALNKYVAAGGRDLLGAEIAENSSTSFKRS